ncbi:MAG: GNAT family N-acetyltransferase [Acidimicrobiia bacterium]|nr:GNAT family N-acetyltransferase [Acidimicrobiia bacterium]
MHIDGYVIEPLTSDRFDDLVAVLGKSGQSGCWCMYWIAASSKEWGDGCTGGARAANRDRFAEIVATAPPPGLIAYDDSTPVAWARVMPRTAMPGLANSRHFKTDLDIDGVWSLSCFVVRRSHRGRGLTGALTKAAAEFAAHHDAAFLEVYPTDTEDEKADSTLYTGKASTFARLGFEVVQRTVPHKPMMRLALEENT